MFTKTLLLAGIALGGLAGSYAGAQAASSGVMGCSPHDWLAFGEAIETQDNDALLAMLGDPELHSCAEIINTVAVLACDADPSACLPPPVVILPPPPTVILLVDVPDDVAPGPGPFPGQAPGQALGAEQNRNDNSAAAPQDDDGNGGGGGGDAGGPNRG